MIDIPEIIQVIFIDIGDDGDGGLEAQKTLAEFAGFADESVALSAARAAADEIQLAADVDGRVCACGHKRLGHHGSGGGLSMGAADAHREIVAGHQFADQLAALDLRDAEFRCFGALHVLRGNCAGEYDQISAVYVFGKVADVDFNALFGEMVSLV